MPIHYNKLTAGFFGYTMIATGLFDWARHKNWQSRMLLCVGNAPVHLIFNNVTTAARCMTSSNATNAVVIYCVIIFIMHLLENQHFEPALDFQHKCTRNLQYSTHCAWLCACCCDLLPWNTFLDPNKRGSRCRCNASERTELLAVTPPPFPLA